MKRFPGWTSVYLGSPAASAGLLRAVARAAGERTVRLRAQSDAYEAFADEFLAQGVQQFDLHIPANTTRLIFLGDVPAFRKALDCEATTGTSNHL